VEHHRDRRTLGEQRRHDGQEEHVLHHVEGEVGADLSVERRGQGDEQHRDRAREGRGLSGTDEGGLAARLPDPSHADGVREGGADQHEGEESLKHGPYR
jgi:hypothetical protein